MSEKDHEPLWTDTPAVAPTPGDDRRGSDIFGPPPHRHDYHPALLIATMVAGVIVVFVAVTAYQEWRARVIVEDIARSTQRAVRQAELQSQQMQREAAQREAQRQAELERKEGARLQAIAERQRADEAVKRAALDEADRKEKAWAKFYKRPAACNDAATMECANAHIRAKRAFEDKYAKGEL